MENKVQCAQCAEMVDDIRPQIEGKGICAQCAGIL